jgi:hypothetical protein
VSEEKEGLPAQASPDEAWRAPSSGFPWPPIVLIAAIVLVSAVVIGYRVTRPAPSGPKVLTDQGFVDSANAVCKEAIPDLRPQSTSRDDIVSPEQIAEQATRSADGLAALSVELRALPAAAEQRTFIEGWLDGWGPFVDAGRRYAVAIRSGDVEAADEIARSGDKAQRQADAFARGNGLDACLLQSAVRKPKGASGGF